MANDWCVSGFGWCHRIKLWLDAQHQLMAIAQRAVQRPAPHVVAVLAATGRIRIRPIRISPTLRRRAAAVAGAAGAVAAGPAAAQGRGGRDPVRLSRTHWPKSSH